MVCTYLLLEVFAPDSHGMSLRTSCELAGSLASARTECPRCMYARGPPLAQSVPAGDMHVPLALKEVRAC